jgi:hypothetical protein
MMNSEKTSGSGVHGEGCLEFPELRRLNYFFGQMLNVQDFQTEQNFFREKLKLHNRCLHGYGVVCGLSVEPVPVPKECDEKQEAEERELWEQLEKLLAEKAAPPAVAPAAAPAGADAAPAPAAPGAPADLDAQIETLRRQLGDFYRAHCKEEPHTCVRIDCGLALDCHGNELIVRRPIPVDLVQWLSPADYQRVKHGAHELYISICHCEQAADPVRPVMQGPCGASPECKYGKWQEGVRVVVSVDPPAADTRCGTCCEPCPDCCLLLARIDCFFPGHELREGHIHNGARRPLGVYTPTTITGVSWRLGHHYTQEQAKHLMGTHDRGEYRGKGLEVRFSRPVLASTIHPGVMDTWVIEGGRGRACNIYNKTGMLVDKPKDGLVDRIFYRDITDETLQPGDRVLVILRTDFILDQCCRPVDGENTGGRVPLLEEYAERYGLYPRDHDEECCVPPKGYGPWTSGNGTPGGTFESWFFIRDDDRDESRERTQGVSPGSRR